MRTKLFTRIYLYTVCLPNPHKLDAYYLHKIYGTLMLVFIMTVFAGYSGRLKRLICAVFYRKREKRRVLYLYNETLRKRTAFFRYMKQKVSKLARENKLSVGIYFLCTVDNKSVLTRRQLSTADAIQRTTLGDQWFTMHKRFSA